MSVFTNHVRRFVDVIWVEAFALQVKHSLEVLVKNKNRLGIIVRISKYVIIIVKKRLLDAISECESRTYSQSLVAPIVKA